MIKHIILLIILTLVVGGALLYAVGQVGSPALARNLKFDEQRISSLSSISMAVESYFSANQRLPDSLSQLQAPRYYINGGINDPETNQPYEYQVTGGLSYKLCTIFRLDSEAAKNRGSQTIYRYPGDVYEKFTHPAGYYCFDLSVNQNLQNTYNNIKPYVPVPVATVRPIQAERSVRPSCTTLGTVMIVKNGKGEIGCDIKVSGEFDLSRSYCEGQTSKRVQNLMPDAYKRSNWYYAALRNLEPTEPVKVYIYSNSGERVECTPTLNQTV